MNASDLAALIHEATAGDSDSYIRLYQAVCRPIYNIARMSLKSEEQAIKAVQETAADSFAALSSAKISGNSAFAEWIVKILCTKIRHIFKTQPPCEDNGNDNPVFDMRTALDSLPDIERLVLAVSSVCGCDAEKTAALCGYTEETVGVCLTNAEVTLKTLMLSGSEQF